MSKDCGKFLQMKRAFEIYIKSLLDFPVNSLLLTDCNFFHFLFTERTPVNFMVKTMSFNTVEGHLLFSTSITSPYALDRPIGIMEHSR